MRLRLVLAAACVHVTLAALPGSAPAAEWLAGDVTGDRRVDLTQVWSGGLDTRVPDADLLYAPLRTAWTPRAGFPIALGASRWLQADVTGDGRADLVQIRDDGVATLTSAADGTYVATRESWMPRPLYGVNPTGTTWLAADVNGDGRADLVHMWEGGINTLLSNANGTYALIGEGVKPYPAYAMEMAATAWLAADANGDGRADLIHLRGAGIDTLLSLGNGTYSATRESWKPRPAYNVHPASTQWLAGDVNADGRADLLHVWSGGINTLLSSGDGTFPLIAEAWRPSSAYNMAAESTRWLAGDADGDGRADLIHIAEGGIDTLLARGDGTAALAVRSPAPPALQGPPAAAPGPPAAVAPLPVTSEIPNAWRAFRDYSRVLTLSVRNVPAGGRVEVRCSGRGCPFTRRSVKVRRAGANVAPLLKKAKLRVGVVVEVRVLAPGATGKVVRFTVRRRALPKTTRLCLPAGATKPVRC